MQLNDKSNFAALRAAIETALEPVAEHHGLKIKTGHLGYEADGSACNITLKIERSDALPKEEREFIQYNHFFAHEGLKPEHLHQSFKFNRETVELIGLRPSATRFPLVVRNNATGKRFCVGCKLVGPSPQRPQLIKGGLTLVEPPSRTKGGGAIAIALVFAILSLGMGGCADPAFQQYIQNRQAAISAMPNGPTKAIAQERLDQQVLADKQRQHQQAANAAAAIAAGVAAGANAYEASRPVYVPVVYPVYHPYYYGW